MTYRREKIKQLWDDAFGDNEDYVDLYLNEAYDPANLRTIDDGSDIVSMLHAIPFAMRLWGHSTPFTYIYAVATAPHRRGEGLMTALLADTLRRLHNEQWPFALLLPSQPSLGTYYARSGFAPFSFTDDVTIAATTGAMRGYRPCHIGFDALYDLYLSLVVQRNNTTVLSREQFHFVYDETRLFDGDIIAVADSHGTPAGIAMLYTWAHYAILKDILCVDEHARGAIFRLIKSRWDRPLTYARPATWGNCRAMARITHVPAMMKHWAMTHPHIDHHFTITDPLIAGNNLSLHVANGNATIETPTAGSTIADIRTLPGILLGLTTCSGITIPYDPIHITLVMD